jgi:hypothetical protein
MGAQGAYQPFSAFFPAPAVGSKHGNSAVRQHCKKVCKYRPDVPPQKTARTEADEEAGDQVRKTPSWPRSWGNFSLSQLYSHRNA